MEEKSDDLAAVLKGLEDLKERVAALTEPTPKTETKTEFWGFIILAVLAAALQMVDALTPEWVDFIKWGSLTYMVARAAPKAIVAWKNGPSSH